MKVIYSLQALVIGFGAEYIYGNFICMAPMKILIVNPAYKSQIRIVVLCS